MSALTQEERQLSIGASEVASVFSVDLIEAGHQVRASRYQLFLDKSGQLSNPFKGNKRTRFGQYFEPAIGAAFRGEYGMTVHKVHRYIPHPTIDRMGASLDFEIVSHPLGRAPLETKNVDEMIYRRWPEVEDADDPDFVKETGLPLLRKRREPPLSMQLQLQAQIACTKRSWGVLALCVGGNELIPIPYPRVEPTISRIEGEIPLFWAEVDSGLAPPIDWSCDAKTVARLYGYSDPRKVKNLRSDWELLEMAREYKALGGEVKGAEKRREELKAKMLMKIGEAHRAFLGQGFSISAGMVAGGPVSFTRKPYRNFNVYERTK